MELRMNTWGPMGCGRLWRAVRERRGPLGSQGTVGGCRGPWETSGPVGDYGGLWGAADDVRGLMGPWPVELQGATGGHAGLQETIWSCKRPWES